MNWVDIVIILILLIFIIIGCVKGFMFSILSIFGGTVNFIISLFLCKPCFNILNGWFGIENNLLNSISSKFTNMSTLFDIELSSFGSQAELSSHVKETINNSSLSGFTKGLLNNTVHITTENVEGTNVTLNNIISKSFATFITLIISFVIVFILIYLVLWILSLISKKAKENNGIRTTDRILGFIFGIVKGFLVIVVIFSILSLFNENGLLHDLFISIKSSTIGNWIYTNVDTFIHKYINFKDIAKSLIDSI